MNSQKVYRLALCTDDALRNAFDFFDSDGSGTIDRSELISYLGDQAAQNTLGDRESLDFEGFKEVVAHLAKMQMEGSANGESSNRFEAIQRKKAETHVNKMKEEKFLPMAAR